MIFWFILIMVLLWQTKLAKLLFHRIRHFHFFMVSFTAVITIFKYWLKLEWSFKTGGLFRSVNDDIFLTNLYVSRPARTRGCFELFIFVLHNIVWYSKAPYGTTPSTSGVGGVATYGGVTERAAKSLGKCGAEKGWARVARVRRAYGSSAIEITTQLSCLTDVTCVTERNERRRLYSILRTTFSADFVWECARWAWLSPGPAGRERHTLVKRKYRS